MAPAGSWRNYPLSVIIQAVDKITGPLKKISGSVSSVGSKISRLGGGIRSLSDRAGIPVLNNAVANVGRSAMGLGRAVAGVGKTMLGLAAAAGLSAAGLSAAAQRYADATGAIGDLSEITGVSRERIQELNYAAQQMGSSAEGIDAAFRKMTITIGNAAKGDKTLKEMFAGLDIQLKNTNGTMKSSDELFDIFVNRISRIKNPALQAEAATKIFGKASLELLPLLREGTTGINKLATEGRRLGVVLSDSAVRAGEDFGDVLDDIKFAARGVFNTIGTQLVPTLTVLGKQLVETIVKYRPQIEAFAAAFAQNLPRYLEQASAGLVRVWDVLQPLGSAIITISDNIGVLNTVLVAIGTYMAVSLVGAVLNVALALKGLGLAISLTPIGWFLLGLAGIAAAAILIYKNWDQFSSFFTDKFESVRKAFKTGIIDGLFTLWKEFNPVGFIMESFNSLIKFFTGFDLGAMIKAKLPSFGGGPEQPAQTTPYTAIPEGGPIAAGLANAKAAITVDFKNLPTGAEVDTQASRGANIKTNQGYSMMRMDQ